MGQTLTEWKDGPGGKRIDYLVSIALLVFLFWVLIQLQAETTKTSEVSQAEGYMLIFTIMIVLVISAWAIDSVADKSTGILTFLGQYASFGKSERHALLMITAGVIVGIILNLQGFLKQSPEAVVLSIGVPTVSIALGYSIRALMVGVICPIVEEKFFGQWLPYSFEAVFSGWFKELSFLPSWILTMFLFGAFHFMAYGGNLSLMFSAMIFRLLVLIGNTTSRSAGFGLGLHLTHNILFLSLGG